jgi:hypothetical protein
MAVMNMIAEIEPKHAADFQNVIADQDKKDALNEGKHSERERFRDDVIRQSNVDISLALQHRRSRMMSSALLVRPRNIATIS